MPKPFEHNRLASGRGDRVVIDADESRFAPGTVARSRRLGRVEDVARRTMNPVHQRALEALLSLRDWERLPYGSAEARLARVRAIADALAQALADRADPRRGQKRGGESQR
jgi:hypothetical protein